MCISKVVSNQRVQKFARSRYLHPSKAVAHRPTAMMGVNVALLLTVVAVVTQESVAVPPAKVIHRDFQHGPGQKLSEDMVLDPVHHTILLSAQLKNKNKGVTDGLQVEFDFENDVAGVRVPRLHRCYLLRDLSYYGIVEEAEEGMESHEAEESIEYGGQPNLQLSAGQLLEDTEDMPADLQVLCADWPVYELTGKELRGEASYGSRGRWKRGIFDIFSFGMGLFDIFVGF